MNAHQITLRKIAILAEEMKLLDKLDCEDDLIAGEIINEHIVVVATDREKIVSTHDIVDNIVIEQKDENTEITTAQNVTARAIENSSIVSVEDIKKLKYFISLTSGGTHNRPPIGKIPAKTKRAILDFNEKVDIHEVQSKNCGQFGAHVYIKGLEGTSKFIKIHKKDYAVSWLDGSAEKWLEENGKYIEHALKNNITGQQFTIWWKRRKPQAKAPYKLDKVGDSYYFIGKQMWPMLGVDDTPENKKIVLNALCYCQDHDEQMGKDKGTKEKGMSFTKSCVWLKNVNAVFGQTVMSYGTSLQSFDKTVTHYPDTKLPSRLAVKPYIPH